MSDNAQLRELPEDGGSSSALADLPTRQANNNCPVSFSPISGFEGVVRPGEMLLVLGRPGSGCSTLLKTLANHRDEFHAVEGNIHYDSLTPAEIARHYQGDVQYCPEDEQMHRSQ
ncbi:hypothetical protein BDZ94DRAFT_1373768 [Collybia nuda]|uniref:ABC transporter domain-containing protein n=1 Tax=Collybia nuda TaxID=64659 RepID=A0A9P5Y2K3_9AGAR|nr:hypothetical protein BDZ94DRAFT_1373768 [Collybia nuda]